MTRSTDTRLRRSVRRFTLGSGPLKRGSDRMQVVGRVVVVLSFLVAPLFAVSATNAITSHLQTVAAAQEGQRHLVQAVLMENAPVERAPGNSYAGPDARDVVPVSATWPGPGGTTREGQVLAPLGTTAGTAVPVWLDAAGNLARAPLRRDTIPAAAATLGAVLLIGLPAATWACYGILSWALDSYRERRWAQGWAVVAPRWRTNLL